MKKFRRLKIEGFGHKIEIFLFDHKFVGFYDQSVLKCEGIYLGSCAMQAWILCDADLSQH